MPDLTPNLGIKKPLGNEAFSRAAINENYDIIDAAATKTATANKLVQRDASGRAKVAAPAASDDVARKDTVDNAITRGMLVQAIINGNMDITQRGTSFTNPLNAYTLDRWVTGTTGEAGMPTLIHSAQRLDSGDIPGSYYFYRVNASGAGSGFGTSTEYAVMQRIENGTRFLCGAGKKVSLSFYARASVAGKRIGVSLGQRYGTGDTPSPNEVLTGQIFTLSSTWTKYTFTFNTNTLVGKSFGTNRDDQLLLKFFMAWGTTTATANFGSGTAETFGGSGNIDFAQVQINAGDTALPFQPRSFAEELALCQRYYEKSYPANIAPGTNTGWGLHVSTLLPANYTAGSRLLLGSHIKFKVEKRLTPTVTFLSDAGAAGSWWAVNYGGINVGTNFTCSTGVNIVTSNAVNVTQAGDIYGHWMADAEL